MTHGPSASETVDTSSAEERLHILEAQVLQLQITADQAKALFQNAPHAAVLLSAQGRLLEINIQGAALLISLPDILVGRIFARSLTPDSRTTFMSLLDRVFAGQGRQTGEVQAQLPNGQLLDLLVEAALHAGTEEAPMCHLTVTDVTAFKTAHRTLLDTVQAKEQQLRDGAAKLRQLNEEFEGVMRASERALGGNIGRAQNFLALFIRHYVTAPEESLGSLKHVEEALEQTQGLLGSLKHYMRTYTLRARAQPVDLNRVVREVLKDVAPQSAGRDVEVTSMPLPVVQGDSQVLQIIVQEYVSNALKFTRTRERVRLRILAEEDALEYRIGVQDNGVGFNMRQKDKAFELFGRLHATEQYEGTGLGLAVVRRLCERFGGRAWGEGKVGQGATFWFSWPKSSSTP